ncbi:MAG: hypothetical protein ABI658_19475 [Acidimicrobiales bacterium]
MLARHVVDDDVRPAENAVAHEASLDSDLGSSVSPGNSPVLAPTLRLVVNEASSIACASFADACVSAQTWVPDAMGIAPPLRLVVNEASSVACASFADACVSAQTWVPAG